MSYKPVKKHVRFDEQTRKHCCRWPGCKKQVPGHTWGCRRHWFFLPHDIRSQIMSAYRPGQEVSMIISPAYVEADKAAQDWIKENKRQHEQEHQVD